MRDGTALKRKQSRNLSVAPYLALALSVLAAIYGIRILNWYGASEQMKLAVVLLSGGIDSTVAAVMKAGEASTIVHLLTVQYDQGAMDSERVHAYKVADWLLLNFHNVVEHFELTLRGEVRSLKRSVEDLSGMCHELPLTEPTGFVGWRRPGTPLAKAGYPSTRDETFTLLGAAGAEARLRDLSFVDSAEVVLATNKDDLASYEDIFVDNYTTHLTAILDRKKTSLDGRRLSIDLPLIRMSKVEVIERGIQIGAPLQLTWSCYFGEDCMPCTKCDQCRWRSQAFQSVGVVDPFPFK